MCTNYQATFGAKPDVLRPKSAHWDILGTKTAAHTSCSGAVCVAPKHNVKPQCNWDIQTTLCIAECI